MVFVSIVQSLSSDFYASSPQEKKSLTFIFVADPPAPRQEDTMRQLQNCKRVFWCLGASILCLSLRDDPHGSPLMFLSVLLCSEVYP